MQHKLKKILANFDSSILTDYTLAILCGLFLARMTLEAFVMMNVSTIKNTPFSVEPIAEMVSSTDLNMIFNKSDKPKELAKPTFDQAGIIIKGIFYTPPKSSVIMSVEKKGEYIYFDGDTIINNIKIASVEPNKVIFDDAGQLYELMLEDETIDLFKGIEYNDTPDVLSGSSSGEENAGAPPTSVSGTQSISGNAGAGKILEEVEKNPTAIFKYLSFKQEFDGEALKGVRITLKSNAEVFQQAGLQTGDLVIGLNGFGPAEFSTPKFLNGLKNAKQLDFEIEREGLKHNISVSR